MSQARRSTFKAGFPSLGGPLSERGAELAFGPFSSFGGLGRAARSPRGRLELHGSARDPRLLRRAGILRCSLWGPGGEPDSRPWLVSPALPREPLVTSTLSPRTPECPAPSSRANECPPAPAPFHSVSVSALLSPPALTSTLPIVSCRHYQPPNVAPPPTGVYSRRPGLTCAQGPPEPREGAPLNPFPCVFSPGSPRRRPPIPPRGRNPFRVPSLSFP